MQSGVPLSAWAVLRSGARRRLMNLASIVWPSSQIQQTTDFFYLVTFFPLRYGRISLHSMCFLSWWIHPPQHPEGEQWVHEALAWCLLKAKNMSLAAFLCVSASGLVRAGSGEEGQAQEFSMSPAAGESRTTTLVQGLWGGFYRGGLCQLNQYRGRFHTYCGNLQRCVGWGRKSHRIS